MSSDEDDSISYVESLNFSNISETSSGDDNYDLLVSRLQQLAANLNHPSSSSSSSSSSSLDSSSESRNGFNILITGSKCTGKSSLCETLLLLFAKHLFFNFEYMDVNHFRYKVGNMPSPLNESVEAIIKKRLHDGNLLIEDTIFDIYEKNSFSAIFILKVDDDVLEKRLIFHDDFHTPYNDFHVMEPYNTICENFPFTKSNEIFILDNTLDRHLEVNAKFILKWVDEFINPIGLRKPKNLDSDGESHRSDSDDSDANETLIHFDGKFKKSFVYENDNNAPEIVQEFLDNSE